MKLYSKILVLAILFGALTFAACTKIPEETTSSNTTEGSTAEVTTEPASGSDDYYIHSISELNTENYALDSAAGNEKNSRLELNFRETTTLSGISISNIQAYYPRVKIMPDGSYIMVFHNSLYGANIYFTTSKDGLKWTNPRIIFQMTSISVNGTADRRKYMTPDAVVLENGDIIVATSFRADKSYQTAIDYNGVAIRRSSDGGKTWAAEQVVYVGTNWEPFITEVDNGEIYIFFSCTAPSIYANGEGKFDERSSGIALVRSKDGGKTWIPNVTGAPYIPQYVMRQQTGTFPDGVKKYTDQMPCMLQLNDGSLVLAAESHLMNGSFKFSVCYSDDYWAFDVGTDATGPSNRKTNLFNLAGPYLAQFPSGETVMSYHWSGTMRYRMANRTFTSFYDEVTLFTDTGMWGNLALDSSHSVLASIGLEAYGIRMGRLYLNHSVNAKKLTPVLDGKGGEWESNTDALFIGSQSQAQIAVRVAYDDNYVYYLVERLDYNLTDGDYINLFIDDGTRNFLMLKLNLEGIAMANYYDAAAAKYNSREISELGVNVKIYIDGTMNNAADKDIGASYEIAVPRTLVNTDGNMARILLTMQNKDDANNISDDITGTTTLDKSTWFTANLK